MLIWTFSFSMTWDSSRCHRYQHGPQRQHRSLDYVQFRKWTVNLRRSSYSSSWTSRRCCVCTSSSGLSLLLPCLPAMVGRAVSESWSGAFFPEVVFLRYPATAKRTITMAKAIRTFISVIAFTSCLVLALNLCIFKDGNKFVFVKCYFVWLSF